MDPYSQLLRSLQNRQLQKFRDILRQVDDDGNALVDPSYIYGKPYNATCLEVACREEDCVEYIRELLNASANPNAVNTNTKQTPLHLAAELGNHEALSILFEDRRTNVNAINGDGKTVLHLIAEHDEDVEENKTMECLNLVLNNPKINSNARNKFGQTPLDSAIQANRRCVVETMEDRLNTEYSDILCPTASRNVIYETIQINRYVASDCNKRTRLDEITNLFQLLYDRNLEGFKERFSSIIHTTDELKYCNDGNYTFLQYATLHELKDVVRILLENEVNPNAVTEYEKRPPIILACMRKNYEILKMFLVLDKNRLLEVNFIDAKGNTALHYATKDGDLGCVVELMRRGADIDHKNVFDKPPLPAKYVKCLLDKSLNPNDRFPDDEDYRLVFDYSFLLAHEQKNTEKIPHHGHDATLQQNCEVDSVVKNFSFCLNSEMEFLFHISKSDEARGLMKHPLITSFLHIKWHRVKFAFALNICIYILYVLLFNSYILHKIAQGAQNVSGTSFIKAFLERFTIFSIGLFVIYFIVREIVQMSLSFKTYYKNCENIIDVGLILITLYILLFAEWYDSFVVIAILLSWTELILLTGRLPKLSRNIQMFKNVSMNYFWFLLSYIFLIIAFAFSFYSLIQANVGNKSVLNSTAEYEESETSENNYDFFSNPWLSILKTFIMMMGEFEAGTLLPQMVHFQTCFWLFSFFVFLMAMVLINLLTGLAVSDIQTIKDNAEELSLKSHIRLIYDIERNILQWHRFVQNRCKWKLFRPFVIFNELLFRNINVFPPNSAQSSKNISIYPNKGAKIVYESFQNNSTSDMDLEIIGSSIRIISNRNKETEMNQIYKRLDHLEEAIKENHDEVHTFQERVLLMLREMHGYLKDHKV